MARDFLADADARNGTGLGHDARTPAYLTRREIIRIIKRYISRELFRLLTATRPRRSTT